jgi:predicted small lipoprotein YifL
MIPLRALCVLLAAATLLAACGRVGPVRPPGPRDQITYPRTYPSR